MLSIRLSKSDDLLQLYKIERQCHEYPWTLGILQDCFKVGYLMHTLTIPCPCEPEQEIIIGFMVNHVVLDECHLLDLNIIPNQQRKGYAKAALSWLVKLLSTKAIKTIFLEVRASNQGAIQLYQSMGFEQIGVRENYYPTDLGREAALVMKKLL